MKARSQPEMRAALAQAEAIMRSRRHLRPREPNDFALETADEVLDFWGKISRVLFVALPGLVAISLVVGGIVIMNIMLMAVAERDRKSTRLNSSHTVISYAVFCLKKKKY